MIAITATTATTIQATAATTPITIFSSTHPATSRTRIASAFLPMSETASRMAPILAEVSYGSLKIHGRAARRVERGPLRPVEAAADAPRRAREGVIRDGRESLLVGAQGEQQVGDPV